MSISTFAVKGIILNEDNQFLLLQRNPKNRDKSNWDLPGGLVEDGEEEKSALVREIQEELKLNVEIITKAGKWKFYRLLDKQIVTVQNYFCNILKGTIELSKEHIAYKWVSVNEIKNYPVKDESLYTCLTDFFKEKN